MGNLTENFSRYEFECQCGCGQDTVDAELVHILQDLRNQLNLFLMGKGRTCSIKINCGNRCVKHNAETPDSSKNSRHIDSRASDFIVIVKSLKDPKSESYLLTPQVVYNFLEQIVKGKFGIIVYEDFIHFDTRNEPYRKLHWENNE